MSTKLAKIKVMHTAIYFIVVITLLISFHCGVAGKKVVYHSMETKSASSFYSENSVNNVSGVYINLGFSLNWDRNK